MRSNAVYVMFAQVAIVLTPLVLTPYLTRVIGAEGLGLYSFSFTTASAFMIVGQLGVQLYGRREIAKCNGDRAAQTRVFWELVTLVWRAFSIILPVFVIVALHGPFEEQARLALLIQIVLLLSGALDVSWLFHGVEKFKLLTISMVITRLLSLLFVFIFIENSEDTLKYVGIMATAFLFAQALPWVFVRRFVGQVTARDWVEWWRLRELWHFLVPAVALQSFGVTSVVVITMWASLTDVGIYDVAFRLARAPIAFITAFGIVLLPRATRMLTKGGSNQGQKLLRQGMSVTMFLASAFCFALIGIADSFIPLFAGTGFESAVPVLRVLSLTLLVIGWGNVLRTQIILPGGLDRLYASSLVGGLLLTILLSIVFINLFGLLGVAFAFLTGELFTAVIQARAVRNRAPILSLLFQASRYVGAGCAAAVTMVMLQTTQLAGVPLLAIQGLCGAAVFLLATIGFEAISKEQYVLGEVVKVLRKFGRS